MVKIEKLISVNCPCYKAGKKITPKGLILHSVGCPQPSADVWAEIWNKSTNKVGVHAIVDDKKAIQCLPWNHRGWHVGGSGNSTHIGIEMAEPNCIKYSKGSAFTCTDKSKARKHVEATYLNAVDVFAYLCKKYKIDPIKGILSHSEAHKKGIASNHGDPEHLWKGLGLKYTMDGFRKDVKATMGESAKTVETEPAFKPYIVRVTCDVLKIREKPTSASEEKGYVKINQAFTITEEANGWGKLLSGAGWISLRHTEKVSGK